MNIFEALAKGDGKANIFIVLKWRVTLILVKGHLSFHWLGRT